jgi:hypothetical protein
LTSTSREADSGSMPLNSSTVPSTRPSHFGVQQPSAQTDFSAHNVGAAKPLAASGRTQSANSNARIM